MLLVNIFFNILWNKVRFTNCYFIIGMEVYGLLEERLRELRLKAGLKQQDLLNKFGISSARYSQYETGKRTPDYELLIEIANFYDVSLDYLLGRTDDPTPPQKEKTPSRHEGVLQDLEDLSPDMELEVREFINYLKHKNNLAAAAGGKN